MLHISQEDRLKIIQRRINQYNIRFPVATLNKEIGEDMGNISKMLKGKKTITDNFFTSFNEKFPEKKDDSEKQYNEQEVTNYILPIGNVKITLADYIELLQTTNERLFAIVNSTLGQIHDDSRYALAYQKAWVRYEAEKASEGNKKKEDEIAYKMGKLVDDEIKNRDVSRIPGKIDKRSKEGQ